MLSKPKGRDFTLAELCVIARFLRDTPLTSLARTIVKARWLHWYDKGIADVHP